MKTAFKFSISLIGANIISFIASFAQGNLIIYNQDSTLAKSFVDQLCDAARNKLYDEDQGNSSRLEILINRAAGVAHQDSLQAIKAASWWLQYRDQCFCDEKKKFPAGNLLIQVVHADFRDFANQIGPRGKYPMALHENIPGRDMTLLHYVIEKRNAIQDRYQQVRSRYQNNKKWKQWMFYFMLLTEYKVQYEVIQESNP